MRTSTLFISFAKLVEIDDGVTIATLALVCNDLAIANPSLDRYSKMKSKSLGHVRRGGRMYFARMHCGHLNEGMEAIRQVRDNRDLKTIVDKCSQDARAAFDALCQCLPHGREHKNFERYVAGVRNRVAFHYDPGELLWAMQDRAGRPIGDTSHMTAGEDIHSTRFEFGDDLLDSIVSRRLWKISRSADVRAEADRIGDWCVCKCREFLLFAQDFVPRFLRGRATVG